MSSRGVKDSACGRSAFSAPQPYGAQEGGGGLLRSRLLEFSRPEGDEGLSSGCIVHGHCVTERVRKPGRDQGSARRNLNTRRRGWYPRSLGAAASLPASVPRENRSHSACTRAPRLSSKIQAPGSSAQVCAALPLRSRSLSPSGSRPPAAPLPGRLELSCPGAGRGDGVRPWMRAPGTGGTGAWIRSRDSAPGSVAPVGRGERGG